jgi:predicted dehydrogenase
VVSVVTPNASHRAICKTFLEAGIDVQAAWRTNPAQAGASFIVGDLGTHCFHLSEFVTGSTHGGTGSRPADNGAGSAARG